MNYEKFGICVTIAIVVCLCGLAAVASGYIDLDVSGDERKILFPTSSTKTDNNNAYYEWCYKMKIDCN